MYEKTAQSDCDGFGYCFCICIDGHECFGSYAESNVSFMWWSGCNVLHSS